MQEADATAAILQAAAASRPDGPFRIGIDGRSAAGKTSFALRLARTLEEEIPRPVVLAGIDGFHRPRIERYRRGRYSPEGYYNDARDYCLCVEELLAPLGPGGDRKYRTRSFELELDEPSKEPFRAAPEGAILIFEGDFLQRPEFAGCWELLVLLRTSSQAAAVRGAARDAARLGSYEAALALHEIRYQSAFDLYEAECRPEEGADIIVSPSEEPGR